MTRLRRFAASAHQGRVFVAALALVAASTTLCAHSGPPFPIVTDAKHGPYMISIWTDPDATDNGTSGGQFWIVIAPSDKGATLPADTRATVTVRPSAPPSPSQTSVQSARTEPVRDDVTNQFGAVLMDHEGPYAVHVDVTGAMGSATMDAMVDATYDLRPPPYMLIWYLLPFLGAGALWTRLLLRRRAGLPRRTIGEGGSRSV
jgi:hypothetical protein